MTKSSDYANPVTVPGWIYQSMLVDQRTLNAVGYLLDRTEWDASTIEQVADLVRASGRQIRGPNEEE